MQAVSCCAPCPVGIALPLLLSQRLLLLLLLLLLLFY
jgi:hypothetical protein